MGVKVGATIDLSAIKHNLSVTKQLAPGAKIAAVVKADAYGHGLLPTVSTLNDSDLYAVARLEEARNLRLAGIQKPILLLSGYIDKKELSYAIKNDLQLVIHHPVQLELLAAAEQDIKKPLTIWLKLDTGMHRLGLNPSAFIKAYQQLSSSHKIEKVITMTHFSSADEIEYGKTTSQLERLLECRQQLAAMSNGVDLSKLETSTANSAGIIAWPESHGDWIRPGLMLYGVNPIQAHSELSRKLIPAMTFSSQVIAVNTIGHGESVGYNEQWTSTRSSRIGVIAIGYGDGYPFKAKEGTPVLINGHRVPLVGKVSMDLITVDITDFPDVAVGDSVTLWGKDLPVTEIANCADTIPYELLTGLTSRVTFNYVYDTSSWLNKQSELDDPPTEKAVI